MQILKQNLTLSWGDLSLIWQSPSVNQPLALQRILLPEENEPTLSSVPTFSSNLRSVPNLFASSVPAFSSNLRSVPNLFASSVPDNLPPLIWPDKFPLNLQLAIQMLVFIPPGHVISYQEFGNLLYFYQNQIDGHTQKKIDPTPPRRARLIGQAMARNPFPILFPCHRVVQSNGNLGGYRGGTALKKKILLSEGVIFKNGGAQSYQKKARVFEKIHKSSFIRSNEILDSSLFRTFSLNIFNQNLIKY